MTPDPAQLDPAPATRPRWPRLIRIAAAALITLTAALWTAFVLLDGMGHMREDGPIVILYMLMFIAPLALVTLLAWRWPRMGGLAAIALGAFTLYYFPHPAPRLAGAAPLIAAGLALLLLPRRSASTAAMQAELDVSQSGLPH